MATSLNATPTSPPQIIDDKSPHCIPFILSRLSLHQAATSSSSSPTRPFIIGLNGVQGAGKTTLVLALATTLRSSGLETLVCSIDDLYLPYTAQRTFAQEHAQNPLVQHRGEPGTHDMVLARELFEGLLEGREVRVPMYDKSMHGGAGDRVPESLWEVVNAPGEKKVQVVIFEGWCVGFRALKEEEVVAKQKGLSRTLHSHRLEDLLFVNEKLREYDVMSDAFDAFIHIDAEDTEYVYEWRLEQEAKLRRDMGSGMSDEMVREFVDGYYPAYELFTDGLREGVLRGKSEPGAQLRLIVGRDRRVTDVITV